MEMTKAEPQYTEYQGWNEWADKYKPIKNHLVSDPDQQMFETYGEELEYVQSVEPNRIWTYLQGDMSDLICAGYHFVNRIGYYITEVPWTNEDDYVLLSVEEECKCYSEDEDVMATRNDEYGDPSCVECEGYGYVTNYV
jgi:hypothetical protein